jgi:sulfoquinovosyltransferase
LFTTILNKSTTGKNYLGFIPRVEEMSWALLRFAHSKADLTLVTSPQMKTEMEDNGIPRVDVWRKGIDTERFHPTFMSDSMRSRMSDGNPNDFLMVYVGRLGAEKRLKDIKPMLQQMPNARLCIVGKGPQMEELQDYFRGEKAVFLGQLSGDDLSSAFASADAFIMPSDSETLGFVVLESMASGVPVVGAAAGGIIDLIDHGKTGYLAPPGDIPTYVQHLKELQDAKLRQRMGKSARTEAERWGWEAATNHLRTAQYDQALKNYAIRNEVVSVFGTSASWIEFFDWRLRRLVRKVDRRMRGQDSVWRSLGRRIFRLPKFFGRRSVIA